MIVAVLFPVAVLALLVLLAVVFFQRREAMDLSPRGLLRTYLYLASLAGIITLAIGLASLANYGLASALGSQVIYGGSPIVRPAIAKCPPGATGCFEPSAADLDQQRRQEQEQRERRKSEDLLRGLTFTAFGALVWGTHWVARRGLDPDEAASGLRRAYLMLGTVIFGLATVIMLPTGLYQALASAIIPADQFTYREAADSLGGGIACLPIWLLFLGLLRRDLREGPVRRFSRGPDLLPPERPRVGAVRITPPDTRSAGAAAVPPEER